MTGTPELVVFSNKKTLVLSLRIFLISISLVSSCAMVLLKLLKLMAVANSFTSFLTWLPASVALDLISGFLIFSSCRISRSRPHLGFKHLLIFLWTMCLIGMSSIEFSFWSFTGSFIDWKVVLSLFTQSVGTSSLSSYGLTQFLVSIILQLSSSLILSWMVLKSLDIKNSQKSNKSTTILIFFNPEPQTPQRHPLRHSPSSTSSRFLDLEELEIQEHHDPFEGPDWRSLPGSEKEKRNKEPPNRKQGITGSISGLDPQTKIKIGLIIILTLSCLSVSSDDKMGMYQVVGNSWVDLGAHVGWYFLFGEQVIVADLGGQDDLFYEYGGFDGLSEPLNFPDQQKLMIFTSPSPTPLPDLENNPLDQHFNLRDPQPVPDQAPAPTTVSIVVEEGGEDPVSSTKPSPLPTPGHVVQREPEPGLPFQSPQEQKIFKPKHVVVIIGESIRRDVFPFDYQSQKFSSIIKNKVKENKEITPFITRLKEQEPNNLAFIDSYTSVSTFTTKTIISLFCEVWPLNLFFTLETKTYIPCIPALLKKENQKDLERDPLQRLNAPWKTSFFTPSFEDFDRFDYTVSSMSFEKGVFGGNLDPTLPKINTFGRDDFEILPSLETYLSSQLDNPLDNQDNRIFTSILTSTSHLPYNLPKDVERVEFLEKKMEGLFSNYLSTVNRFDAFVDSVMELFRKRGLMNETLFVIAGDHGAPFELDGLCTHESNQRCFEEFVFQPTLVLYSQSPDFDAQQFSSSTKNRTWTQIDLSATLKEMMGISTPPVLESLSDPDLVLSTALKIPLHQFFGRSMLHPELIAPDNVLFERTSRTPLDRLLSMIVSPGGGDLMIRDPFAMKIARIRRVGTFIKITDLLDPKVEADLSDEQRALRSGENEEAWLAWITKYALQLEIELQYLFKRDPDILIK